MFVTMWYLIGALAADYTPTLLMALSSGGEITPLPLGLLWKIVKKSFKNRIYVRFAIIKVSLNKAGFAQNG